MQFWGDNCSFSISEIPHFFCPHGSQYGVYCHFYSFSFSRPFFNLQFSNVWIWHILMSFFFFLQLFGVCSLPWVSKLRKLSVGGFSRPALLFSQNALVLQLFLGSARFSFHFLSFILNGEFLVFYISFHYFFFLRFILCVCLCTWVQVPWGLEACDPSGAGVTGRGRPLDMAAGTDLRSSTGATSTLNHWAGSLTPALSCC